MADAFQGFNGHMSERRILNDSKTTGKSMNKDNGSNDDDGDN